MAKKRAANRSTFAVGAAVKVKSGVSSPDMPDFSIEGWTGTVSEVATKKPPRKYMVEWDDATLTAMPAGYLEFCEQQQLYHRMICLGEADLEPTNNRP